MCPRNLELSERLPGRCRHLQPVLNIVDRRPPVLALALPLNRPRVDSYRLVGRHRGQHPHKCSSTGQRNQEWYAVSAVSQEVLEQVDPAGDLRTTLARPLKLHPVGCVGKTSAAPLSFYVHKWLTLDRSAQAKRAGDFQAVGGSDSNNRGVIALDGVGAIKIGLHRLDIVHPAAADDGKCRHDGVSQRIGHNAIDDWPATQAAATGPRRPGPVPDRARPCPHCAHPEYWPDLEGVFGEHPHCLRPEALEADLDYTPAVRATVASRKCSPSGAAITTTSTGPATDRASARSA